MDDLFENIYENVDKNGFDDAEKIIEEMGGFNITYVDPSFQK